MESTARPVDHEDIGTELVRDWEPSGSPKALVILVHGIAEHSGRYERTGSLMSDAGFHVRSFDLIGHGASGGDRVDIDDWRRFHDQIDQHMSWAREQGPPVVLMGHSMGGNLALGHVIAGHTAPDVLVVSAPMLSGGAAWQRVAAAIGSKVLPRTSMPQKIEGSALSRDPEVGETYLSDPLVHTSVTFRFGSAMLQAMEDVRAGAHLVHVPTLVLHGGADRVVSPESTAPLGELPGFERRLYPQLRHEILNEPEGPEVVADIIDWLSKRI